MPDFATEFSTSKSLEGFAVSFVDASTNTAALTAVNEIIVCLLICGKVCDFQRDEIIL